MKNKVLIVVDMQMDFVFGSLGTPEARNIVEKVTQKISDYEMNGHPVIFTMDTHQENYLDTPEGEKLPVKHCIEGTDGWKICGEIWENTNNPIVVKKPTFGSVELMKCLEKYDEIEFIGICTSICVVSNVLMAKAYYPDKKIVVDASCCACVTPESHAAALTTMKMCQIDVVERY